jgi:hypothetical protein
LVKTTTPLELWWCPYFHWRSQWIEVWHVNKNSTSTAIFLLFYMEVIQLLVSEANKYYNQYTDMLDNDTE